MDPNQRRLNLPTEARTVLEQIVRRQTSSQQQVRRAKLILTMAEGKNNQQTAQYLDVHRKTVQQWRSRWLAAVPCLPAAELGDVSDKELQTMISAFLEDETRCGAPVKFSGEQVAQIIAIACSDPQESGRTISHWSAGELADEAVHRGIVTTISARQKKRSILWPPSSEGGWGLACSVF